VNAGIGTVAFIHESQCRPTPGSLFIAGVRVGGAARYDFRWSTALPIAAAKGICPVLHRVPQHYAERYRWVT